MLWRVTATAIARGAGSSPPTVRSQDSARGTRRATSQTTRCSPTSTRPAPRSSPSSSPSSRAPSRSTYRCALRGPRGDALFPPYQCGAWGGPRPALGKALDKPPKLPSPKEYEAEWRLRHAKETFVSRLESDPDFQSPYSTESTRAAGSRVRLVRRPQRRAGPIGDGEALGENQIGSAHGVG